MKRKRTAHTIGIACLIATAGIVPAAAQRPERIQNEIVLFAALDKVTARTSKLEARLDQTVRFGSLKVTPRVCYTRRPEELPKTTTFVEIDEVLLDGSEKRLFTGWMFAESPGLHAVEHPVFDVWLTGCGQPKASVAQKPGGPAGAQPPPDERRRRPPR